MSFQTNIKSIPLFDTFLYNKSIGKIIVIKTKSKINTNTLMDVTTFKMFFEKT